MNKKNLRGLLVLTLLALPALSFALTPPTGIRNTSENQLLTVPGQANPDQSRNQIRRLEEDQLKGQDKPANLMPKQRLEMLLTKLQLMTGRIVAHIRSFEERRQAIDIKKAKGLVMEAQAILDKVKLKLAGTAEITREDMKMLAKELRSAHKLINEAIKSILVAIRDSIRAEEPDRNPTMAPGDRSPIPPVTNPNLAN